MRLFNESKLLQYAVAAVAFVGVCVGLNWALNGPWLDITPRNPPAGWVRATGPKPVPTLPPAVTPTPYYKQPASGGTSTKPTASTSSSPSSSGSQRHAAIRGAQELHAWQYQLSQLTDCPALGTDAKTGQTVPRSLPLRPANRTGVTIKYQVGTGAVVTGSPLPIWSDYPGQLAQTDQTTPWMTALRQVGRNGQKYLDVSLGKVMPDGSLWLCPTGSASHDAPGLTNTPSKLWDAVMTLDKRRITDPKVLRPVPAAEVPDLTTGKVNPGSMGLQFHLVDPHAKPGLVLVFTSRMSPKDWPMPVAGLRPDGSAVWPCFKENGTAVLDQTSSTYRCAATTG